MILFQGMVNYFLESFESPLHNLDAHLLWSTVQVVMLNRSREVLRLPLQEIHSDYFADQQMLHKQQCRGERRGSFVPMIAPIPDYMGFH